MSSSPSPVEGRASLRLGIVDYGGGNFLSVVRAVRALGLEPVRIAPESRHEASSLSHLIFPGVGRASQAMAALRQGGLDDVLVRHVEAGKPLLGICVGMQVLGRHSSEDDTAGLGLIDFELRHFRELGVAGPVPHMGWNDIHIPAPRQAAEPAQDDREIWSGRFDGKHVYFVHSYAAPLASTESASVLATCSYGGVTFAAAVARGPIIGLQFHVEKSGQVGLDMLRTFLEMS